MAWSHPTAQGINSAVLERKGREGEREEGKARKKKEKQERRKKRKGEKRPLGRKLQSCWSTKSVPEASALSGEGFTVGPLSLSHRRAHSGNRTPC